MERLLPITEAAVIPPHGAGSDGVITDIDLFAWIAQAEPGELLIYHNGFLVVDADSAVSKLPKDRRVALRRLRDAAFLSAEQGLVHLVQQRLGPDQFVYIAIARAKPQAASLSDLLLAEPEAA